MKRIAIYGKDGIGKSTTVCNIAAAMAQQGLRVLQLGCDPKADSTSAHLNGEQQVTILDTVRTKGNDFELSEIIREGSDGVLCAECGGPIPGSGCAGRGIVTAFDYFIVQQKITGRTDGCCALLHHRRLCGRCGRQCGIGG